MTSTPNFGTPVGDPYRWLEDPAAPRTGPWVDAQSKLTADTLEALPTRADRLAFLDEHVGKQHSSPRS